jgi:anti-sigma regulatory factor (Ser/Thr protein kinase)
MDKLVVSASMEQLGIVIGFVEAAVKAAGCEKEDLNKILVAVDELFTNIAQYAYGDGGGECEIGLEICNGIASVRFTDSGSPYNPLSRKDPDITLSAEERKIGGLGIYMVKKSMDAVEYEHRDGKNILTIRKKIG